MEDLLKHYSKLLDDSNHHLSNETLATFNNLKELLSEKELNFIQKHLVSCSECSKRFAAIQAEDAELDSIPHKTGSFFWQKSFRYAAAAVVLIVVGLWYLFYFSNSEPEQVADDLETIMEDSTIIIQPDVKIIAEDNIIKPEVKKYNPNDFAANQVLENFINRNIRSEAGIRISLPAIGDTVKIPVKFEWESSDEEAEISVVSNKNETIFIATVTGNTYLFNSRINSGLYYWKILKDGKLESVGKFYIR